MAIIRPIARGTLDLEKKNQAGLYSLILTMILACMVAIPMYRLCVSINHDALSALLSICSVIVFIAVWAGLFLVFDEGLKEDCWHVVFEGPLESYEHIIDTNKTIIRLAGYSARIINGLHELPDSSGVLIRVLRNDAGAYQVEI